jgi:thioredoxin 1
MELTFTDANFDTEVIKSSVPVLVDFWAPWCEPCVLMAPIVEELAGDLAGKVSVGKLNVDENAMTAGQFGIMSIPTMLLFVGGHVVEQMVGSSTKDVLKERILKHV